MCFILRSEIQSAYKMYFSHMPHRNITKGTQWNQICMSDLVTSRTALFKTHAEHRFPAWVFGYHK